MTLDEELLEQVPRRWGEQAFRSVVADHLMENKQWPSVPLAKSSAPATTIKRLLKPLSSGQRWDLISEVLVFYWNRLEGPAGGPLAKPETPDPKWLDELFTLRHHYALGITIYRHVMDSLTPFEWVCIALYNKLRRYRLRGNRKNPRLTIADAKESLTAIHESVHPDNWTPAIRRELIQACLAHCFTIIPS